ncbi:cytochrome o ubiquinol oxidase subunit III [Azospirillum sp. B4]|uniref:cytochrome o ubiquinol oxidase subunit III n=1 Tax=Azospirillum sp. B4 TaxID=95605 RepID=UPI0003475EB2|nr:cytochrome o ubiquinol oxidase subunit III [Azospirillum sp. B4]
MTAAAVHHPTTHHGMPAASSAAGPAPKRIIIAYGFWLFLLSDIVMFSTIFATYAVVARATAGGPTGAQLFDPVNVAVETALLLFSSFSCGMMSLAMNARNRSAFYVGAAVTFLLGLGFLALEMREFADMVAQGATPQRSAFLSGFFTLVGCHGAHVAAGLLWLVVMVAQVADKGWRRPVCHRLMCFSLFWHALDIIWVALFTIVYLMGGR